MTIQVVHVRLDDIQRVQDEIERQDERFRACRDEPPEFAHDAMNHAEGKRDGLRLALELLRLA